MENLITLLEEKDEKFCGKVTSSEEDLTDQKQGESFNEDNVASEPSATDFVMRTSTS